jgi:hypothetical protein
MSDPNYNRKSVWFIIQIATILTLLSRTAVADEPRRNAFPSVLLGRWAETAEQCTAKDKSNILIEDTKYGDAHGSCDVRWIVDTPGSHGTNYAVHALCTSASDSAKTQNVNIIIRPQGGDRALMGRSFEDLKNYHRCPAE